MGTANPREGASLDLAVLDDADRVAAILSPLRRRLLAGLSEAPDSAAGLSRRFGIPRQKLNYHLRELERAGFVELAGERRRRGCTERALRPTARAYLVSPGLLGELAADPDAFADRFSSSYLIAVAGRLIRDVGTLSGRAARAGKRLPTLTLQAEVRFASAAARAEFADELARAVAGLAAKYHSESPEGRAYRFVIGGHPVVAGPASHEDPSEAGAERGLSGPERATNDGAAADAGPRREKRCRKRRGSERSGRAATRTS
jgi:DNA-binding transcriptional ArsR family regulator